MDFPHIYPDPESRALRKSLAEFTGVDEEYLLAGSGADELLDLLMRVFLEPRRVHSVLPAHVWHVSLRCRVERGTLYRSPTQRGFLAGYARHPQSSGEFKPKVFFIASPNNPDGSLIEPDVMDELLSLPLLVVLDEAYIEFAGENLGASLEPNPRSASAGKFVVLRTFSKWAGLAGLRIGYGAFPKWLMPILWKSKQPYNVNVAASVAAQASLDACG